MPCIMRHLSHVSLSSIARDVSAIPQIVYTFFREVKRRVSLLRVSAPQRLIWKPQPGPQESLLACPLHEVFFGGARGGGKTDGMLGDFLACVHRYGGEARGVFFRRRFKQLEDAIRRAKEIYLPMGAKWIGGNDNFFVWPDSGATLKFRHLWDVDAAEEYQGHAYMRLYFEEITNWPTPDPIERVKATCRGHIAKGIRLTGNPGGPGHNWVKARYVTPQPLGFKPVQDPVTRQWRVFIPSRLEDNPALTAKDPTYEFDLLGFGSPALVKAWRWGLWDIVAGDMFGDVWNPDRQVLRAHALPETWQLFRSFDWGFSAPSSLGFWAKSDGTQPEAEGVPPDFPFIPRGSLVRIGELYTVAYDPRSGALQPNKGRKLSNADLGALIASYSMGEAGPQDLQRALKDRASYHGCVADPTIFDGKGGKSIYEQMEEGALHHYFGFGEAANNRVAGWMKVRQMLEESAKPRAERPGMWVWDSNEHWIRTVPVAPRDPKKPDDLDTEAEDHTCDETRYAVMGGGTPSREIDLDMGGG